MRILPAATKSRANANDQTLSLAGKGAELQSGKNGLGPALLLFCRRYDFADFSLAQALEVLLGVLPLIAGQGDLVQRIGLFADGLAHFLANARAGLARNVGSAGVTGANGLPLLRITSHAGIVKLLVRLLLRTISLALAFPQAVP